MKRAGQLAGSLAVCGRCCARYFLGWPGPPVPDWSERCSPLLPGAAVGSGLDAAVVSVAVLSVDAALDALVESLDVLSVDAALDALVTGAVVVTAAELALGARSIDCDEVPSPSVVNV
jgi:hypothetical protein